MPKRKNTGDRRQNTGGRRQKLVLSPAEGTENRIGKSGNQDNRVQPTGHLTVVIRITGNQRKTPRCPDSLIP